MKSVTILFLALIFNVNNAYSQKPLYDTIKVTLLVSVFDNVKLIYGYEVRKLTQKVGTYNSETLKWDENYEHFEYLKGESKLPFDVRSDKNPKGKVIVWQVRRND